MDKTIILIIIMCVCISTSISIAGGIYFTQSKSPVPETKSKPIKQLIKPTTPPTTWNCLSGINTPLRKNGVGDVECMSLDNANCLWKSNSTECNALATTPPQSLKPLVCGTMHKSLHGTTGYDNADHWCAKEKIICKELIVSMFTLIYLKNIHKNHKNNIYS